MFIGCLNCPECDAILVDRKYEVHTLYDNDDNEADIEYEALTYECGCMLENGKVIKPFGTPT
jgi:hypothetical protein